MSNSFIVECSSFKFLFRDYYLCNSNSLMCYFVEHKHLFFQIIYDEQVECYKKDGSMLIDKNLPPTAGALIWINKLRGRLSGPIEIIKDLEIE